jgi:NAD(P)-dependent dehydrogenase (short-subunit alcohol dehydrogenase family)
MGIDDEENRWSIYTQAAICAAVALVVWGAAKSSSRKHSTDDSMRGKHVIVTGANTGIGYATAIYLASRGAHVTLACRSIEKGRQAAEAIQRITKNKDVTAEKLDLSDFSSISSFSKRITKCHVLVNNAGAMFPKFEQIGGVELTMLTNHLGPFFLTESLLPKLKQTASLENTEVRIVNVASRLEKRATFVVANQESPAVDASQVDLSLLTVGAKPSYNQWKAYANSKICNLLYTFDLSRRLESNSRAATEPSSARVTVNAVTPGMVNTDLSRFMPWWQRALSFPLRSLILRSPEKGAETVVYASTSPDLTGISGKYLGDCKIIEASVQSQSKELARAVIAESQRIVDARTK